MDRNDHEELSDSSLLVRMLDDSYGLTDPSVVRLDRGAMNANFRIDSGNNSYHLKCYNPRLYQPDKARWTLTIQERIGGAGLPVARVVRNVREDAITETDAGFFALSTFVAGHHYERGQITRTAACSMGESLGRLHQALATFAAARPYLLPDPSIALARLERALVVAESFRSRSALDERCCRVLRHKIARHRRLSATIASIPPMRAQLIHGDYQETNLLFDERDHVAAILDFDKAGFDVRGAEVTRALMLFFLADGVLLPEADDFFAGYCATARPDADEITAYAPLRIYLSALGAWPVEARYLDPEGYLPQWDRFIQEPGDWWERNGDDLTERLLHLARQALDRFR